MRERITNIIFHLSRGTEQRDIAFSLYVDGIWDPAGPVVQCTSHQCCATYSLSEASVEMGS